MSNSVAQIFDLARSGILARLLDLDSASANLANLNTAGFKRGRVNFQETLSETIKTGARARSAQPSMGAGSLRSTENPHDLAIDGEGFFAVRLPDGQTAYTRDGAFRRDGEGQITTAGGHRLVWEGALPPDVDEWHVNPDGTLMLQRDGVWTQAGRIPLSRFANPYGLAGHGENLWLPTPASGQAVAGPAGEGAYGRLVGQALENSNVNLSEEMTRLVGLQRAYSMSVRAFQQADQMLGLAIQMRRE